jgi:hypothetical protein
MDGPLQSLGFLFRYKMEDGGYTAGLSLTLEPMGKVYQKASSIVQVVSEKKGFETFFPYTCSF